MSQQETTQEEQKESRIQRDYYAVRLNKTGNFCIEPKYAKYIEAIFSTYFYDKSVNTYCCELTPSYYLQFLYDDIVFKGLDEDTKENYEIRDEITEYYSPRDSSEDWDGYYLCHFIDSVPDSDKYHYGHLTQWNGLRAVPCDPNEMEDCEADEIVREDLQANHQL